MTNVERLQACFRKALMIPQGSPIDAINYGDSPAGKEWDSLNHMVICSLVENEFDILLDIEQIARIRSYRDAVDVLKEHSIDA